MRKKAKYLHDAPPEALKHLLGPNYDQVNNGRSNSSSNNGPLPISTSASDIPRGISIFSDTSSPYPLLVNQQNQMPPPLQARLPYRSQLSPLPPTFQNQVNCRSPMQGLSITQVPSDIQNTFDRALFDPSNPALFNFDLESLNFGNHYGALEFGILSHISSRATETPQEDNTRLISSQGAGEFNNWASGNNMGQFNQMYSHKMTPGFVGIDHQNSTGQMYTNNDYQSLPHTYAIAAGTTSHHGLSTDASLSASTIGFESSPTMTNYTPSTTPHQSAKQDTQPTGAQTSDPLQHWAYAFVTPHLSTILSTNPTPILLVSTDYQLFYKTASLRMKNFVL